MGGVAGAIELDAGVGDGTGGGDGTDGSEG